jgi:hypothetical protein
LHFSRIDLLLQGMQVPRSYLAKTKLDPDPVSLEAISQFNRKELLAKMLCRFP